MVMLRKVMQAEITGLGDDEVEVVISTGDLARDGHIFEPAGAQLANYRSNPIVLWQHDPMHPVGRAEEVRVAGNKIRALIRFAPTGISHKADEVRGLVKSGIVSGISVGIEPEDSEPIDPRNPRGGQRVTKWELLECSFCSVPVDVGAGVTARAVEELSAPRAINASTATRAGRVLSAANRKQLEAAEDHDNRAMKHHRSLGRARTKVGDQLDNLKAVRAKASKAHADMGAALVKAQDDPYNRSAHLARAAKSHKALTGHLAEIATAQSALADSHQDAVDANGDIGDCITAAQRCVRAVIDSANKVEDGDSRQTQKSGGTSEDEGSRSLDFRRRQIDVLQLGAAAQEHPVFDGNPTRYAHEMREFFERGRHYKSPFK